MSGGELMVTDKTTRSREWCIFRNMVHAVYREARHLGPKGDPGAKVIVSSGRLLPACISCRQARKELKSGDLYWKTARAGSTAEILGAYQEKTHLSLDDLISVFELPGWSDGYGGPPWASIAQTLKQLVAALNKEDSTEASRITNSVFHLCHNHGRLVPSRVAWEHDQYLQEKWPELCD